MSAAKDLFPKGSVIRVNGEESVELFTGKRNVNGKSGQTEDEVVVVPISAFDDAGACQVDRYRGLTVASVNPKPATKGETDKARAEAALAELRALGVDVDSVKVPDKAGAKAGA